MRVFKRDTRARNLNYGLCRFKDMIRHANHVQYCCSATFGTFPSPLKSCFMAPTPPQQIVQVFWLHGMV